MQRGAVIGLACLILIVGVCAALLFRKQPVPLASAPGYCGGVTMRQEATTAVQQQPLSASYLLGRVDPFEPSAQQSQPPCPDAEPALAPEATISVSGIRLHEEVERLPPSLSTRFPTVGAQPARLPPTGAHDVEREVFGIEATDDGVVRRIDRHRISDGDTLASLAEKYLGDPRRFREIYDANRDVLASPDMLPIGAQLKIPPPKDES